MKNTRLAEIAEKFFETLKVKYPEIELLGFSSNPESEHSVFVKVVAPAKEEEGFLMTDDAALLSADLLQERLYDFSDAGEKRYGSSVKERQRKKKKQCRFATELNAIPMWQSLFDGNSFEGWEHVGKGRFVIEDGLLKTEGGMGLLWYTLQPFGNCTVRVVYKTSEPSSNSGVFVRIADKPADEWFAVHHGYEIQICDTEQGYHATGSVYSFAAPHAETNAPKSAGEWNTMDITLKDAHITVVLNGISLTEFETGQAVPERTMWYEPKDGIRPNEGYIGLQNHGDADTVFFKEVSVKK